MDATASYRVLIVEDDAALRAMMRHWLERDGHAVEEAGDGPAGLHMAVSAFYDVVFIDIGLPALDGYEIARKLRAAPLTHRPCLIALTANTDDPAVAFDAGFDGHIFKPVEAQTIATVLKEMPLMKRG